MKILEKHETLESSRITLFMEKDVYIEVLGT
jgi:hypothetical protein